MSRSELDGFADIPDPLAPATAAADELVPATLVARLDKLPSPTRPQLRRRRQLALLAALAWGALQALVLGLRGDLARLPLGYAVAWLGAPLLLGAVAIAAAASTGRSGLGVRVATAAALALGAPAVIALLAVGLPPPNASVESPSFLTGMIMCFDFTLAGAAAPFIFALMALRNAFVGAARWRGALVGGAAGMLAATAMNVHCPLVDPMHMLLGHSLPVALTAVVGALVAHRFMRA